jgi:CRISPR system Cascade subunit CasB
MSTLLERIRRYADNRGMMANLRCVLVESKKHRAWPVLNRMGIDIGDDIATLVAGLFSAHPDETPSGNFGNTCRIIEQRRSEKRSDDNKLTPTERRFQHLLSAEPGNELHERIARMVFMAKAQSISVNYEKLLSDLRYWNDRTKTEWGMAFWAPHAVSGDEAEVV